MKKTALLFAFQLLICNYIFGQSVSTETNKTTYKFNEVITYKVIINFKEDSFKNPDFNKLTSKRTPLKNMSTSFIGGKSKTSSTWTYYFLPKESGEIIIDSPIFLLDGKEIKGESKKVIIKESNLTKDELKELSFRTFVDNIKPPGTIQYVVGKEFGYIAILNEDHVWTFHRKLTKDELKKLKELK